MTHQKKEPTATDLEEALGRYRKHFGENYPLCFGRKNGTREEIISRIEECIRTNTKAPEPVYKDGCIY